MAADPHVTHAGEVAVIVASAPTLLRRRAAQAGVHASNVEGVRVDANRDGLRAHVNPVDAIVAAARYRRAAGAAGASLICGSSTSIRSSHGLSPCPSGATSRDWTDG